MVNAPSLVPSHY